MRNEETYSAVLQIAGLVREHGGRSFLVGGCVRDCMLGTASQDYDLEIYGLSAEAICQALAGHFSLDLVGACFGVLKVQHFDIDLSLPRLESKKGVGHKGFDVKLVPELTYRDATARRDFTINAMMLDPLTGEVIDCWDGEADLRRGVLRHVSEHFSEDELRVLRCMQFAARFDFEVAPGTVELCRELSQNELPIERVGGEWEKLLLKGRHPSRGLRFLRACGWLRFYPELQALVGCPQNSAWHPEGDVWEHTLGVLDGAATLRGENEEDNLVLMLAAMCHDFGKPYTTTTNEKGDLISHGHDVAGEDPARCFLERLWHRVDLPKRVLPLVVHHMRPPMMVQQNAQAQSYRRLALAVGRMDLLAAVAKADILGVGELTEPKEVKLARVDEFLRRAQALEVGREAPMPLVKGRHLIQRGYVPGADFSPILKACFEAQLDGSFRDEAGAMAYLDNLLSMRNK